MFEQSCVGAVEESADCALLFLGAMMQSQSGPGMHNKFQVGFYILILATIKHSLSSLSPKYSTLQKDANFCSITSILVDYKRTHFIVMKKYSMLAGAICIVLANLYGIIITAIISPASPAIITTAILTILLLSYIEINKRRVLIENFRRQSFLLFALVIVFQAYYVILSLTLLVYLSNPKNYTHANLSSFIVGFGILSEEQMGSFTLPYYFANFLLFLYYVRCYYVMFWRENIVFIFRYLKSRVNSLNQELLSHLPKVRLDKVLADSICSLCLQAYSQKENITKLHCQHPFHLDCIKIWVMRSNCCPLCRKKVVYH